MGNERRMDVSETANPWVLTENEAARVKRCRDCNVLIDLDLSGWFWQRGATRRGGFRWPIDAANDFLKTYPTPRKALLPPLPRTASSAPELHMNDEAKSEACVPTGQALEVLPDLGQNDKLGKTA